MKTTAVALVMIVAWAAPMSAGQRILDGVLEPEMIAIANGELYVVEGSDILVFSLPDLSPVRRFGRRGEGPGEFKAADFWYNTVTVQPEGILVDGYDKIVYFSKDGRLLREARKPLGISRMMPVGRHFVGIKLDQIESDVQYQCLRLYDAEGAFLRELGRQKSPVQAAARTTEMIPDVMNFAVWEDLIFVEKSREGLVFDVFDAGGTHLYRSELGCEKIRLTRDFENEALAYVKDDPFVKRIGFERFKSISRFVWPDTLPAVRDFIAADGRLYVRTFGRRAGKEEWLLLDLKGQLQGRALLPPPDTAPFLANLYGVHYHTIRDGKLYYLKSNPGTDAWELFVEDIVRTK